MESQELRESLTSQGLRPPEHYASSVGAGPESRAKESRSRLRSLVSRRLRGLDSQRRPVITGFVTQVTKLFKGL